MSHPCPRDAFEPVHSWRIPRSEGGQVEVVSAGREGVARASRVSRSRRRRPAERAASSAARRTQEKSSGEDGASPAKRRAIRAGSCSGRIRPCRGARRRCRGNREDPRAAKRPPVASPSPRPRSRRRRRRRSKCRGRCVAPRPREAAARPPGLSARRARSTWARRRSGVAFALRPLPPARSCVSRPSSRIQPLIRSISLSLTVRSPGVTENVSAAVYPPRPSRAMHRVPSTSKRPASRGVCAAMTPPAACASCRPRSSLSNRFELPGDARELQDPLRLIGAGLGKAGRRSC